MSDAIICDTTVLLYLGRMEQIHMLDNLYSSIYTTETVCQELDTGRVSRPDTIDPRSIEWIQVVDVTAEQLAVLPENQLDAGEQTVLAYAYTNGLQVVGLDDQLAREFAESLDVNVIGTVGILLKAKRENLVLEIRSLLHQLSAQGFYMNKFLFNLALQEADEI